MVHHVYPAPAAQPCQPRDADGIADVRTSHAVACLIERAHSTWYKDGLVNRLQRRIDAVGRWSGEEFVAVLSETDAAGALASAQRRRWSTRSGPWRPAMAPSWPAVERGHSTVGEMIPERGRHRVP
jgi:hypothetical protein